MLWTKISCWVPRAWGYWKASYCAAHIYSATQDILLVFAITHTSRSGLLRIRSDSRRGTNILKSRCAFYVIYIGYYQQSKAPRLEWNARKWCPMNRPNLIYCKSRTSCSESKCLTPSVMPISTGAGDSNRPQETQRSEFLSKLAIQPHDKTSKCLGQNQFGKFLSRALWRNLERCYITQTYREGAPKVARALRVQLRIREFLCFCPRTGRLEHDKTVSTKQWNIQGPSPPGPQQNRLVP